MRRTWESFSGVIWTTRRLLAEGKPCNEMAPFKNYVNRRIEIEHFAALEQSNRREQLLKNWFFDGILVTFNDAFEII